MVVVVVLVVVLVVIVLLVVVLVVLFLTCKYYFTRIIYHCFSPVSYCVLLHMLKLQVIAT